MSKGHGNFVSRAALLLVLALVVSLLAGCGAPQKERFQQAYLDVFDTATLIVGYAKTEEEFKEAAELAHGELLRLHRLYDIYNEYDGINNVKTINDNAGKEPVVVDEDILEMLEFSREMYDETGGRVNVAMGSVLKLWHDARNTGIAIPERAKLPDMGKLQAAAEHIDIDNMVIDRSASTVYLADEAMRLDVGAIAKGYATEKTAQYMIGLGYDNMVLSVGGNVRAIGSKADGEPWQVAIENPGLDIEEGYIEILQISDRTVVTSGVYQRYYTVDGVNYHHIINEKTLMPAEGYQSISIVSDNSGLADAYSTALFNMQPAEGRAFIENVENTEAMWVFPDGEKVYSSGFEAHITE